MADEASLPEFTIPNLDGIWDDLAEKMGLKGHVYRDIPRLNDEAYEMLVNLVGDENITWLAQTRGTDKEGTKYTRGQCFISPAGIERMKAHVATQQVLSAAGDEDRRA